MGSPPRIWLDYRPVRIGWVIDEPDIRQLAVAASWSTCLWGGRFNPIIPLHIPELGRQLVQECQIDVLIPVSESDVARTFIASYPHLQLNDQINSVFEFRECRFIDVRHAVEWLKTTAMRRGKNDIETFVRPTWSQEDALSTLFGVLFGNYPPEPDIGIDYVKGIRGSFTMPDQSIKMGSEVPADFCGAIHPLLLSGLGFSWRRLRGTWPTAQIVLGDAQNFDDLVLTWNLLAEGAETCFYDQSASARLSPYVSAFLTAIRGYPQPSRRHLTVWGRRLEPPWDPSTIALDFSDLTLSVCLGERAPRLYRVSSSLVRPRLTSWQRDVVASYSEGNGSAVASFSLPDRPFDDEDLQALGQQFVVTVDASQSPLGSDDLTFQTPYAPRLNEFYGRHFSTMFDHARSESGSFGAGAVGVIAEISRQRLEVRAFRVHDWLRSFFELAGISIERSEPGLRASRLIQQLGGLRGSHVLKVRGARELIQKFGPDQSFTRGQAEKCIGNFDESSNRMHFEEFEGLYIQPRDGGKLTPGEVLQYMTTRGVFRVGLEFKCPTCQLRSWVHLDDVSAISTCVYCGIKFDVTPQLKDRDWRYRRSGLFGRDDNQLGGIPVALALSQLEISMRDKLLMYSTSLNFSSSTASIENCEADFVAVVGGSMPVGEYPLQILIGEAKTHTPFDAKDARNLAALATSIPRDVAEVYIMFAKTSTFTREEILLAKTLNVEGRARVILWSVNELEPYHAYARSKDRLKGIGHGSTLSGMVAATNILWLRDIQT